jgi:hypothetical protein
MKWVCFEFGRESRFYFFSDFEGGILMGWLEFGWKQFSYVLFCYWLCQNKYPPFIMGVLASTQSAFFFSFKFWGRGERGERIFFLFSFVGNMFPSSSQWVPPPNQVPNMFPKFPMCSPRMSPIAPHFNRLCFAQSPPLLTYISGPKGEALHCSIESSVLGSLHRFNFFLWWANQIGSLQKKSWTCEATPTN